MSDVNYLNLGHTLQIFEFIQENPLEGDLIPNKDQTMQMRISYP